ncbi:hypothetical protein [Arthrobacter sp. NPDC090010]|uniref:hypothetical protein n=1 Tax=Arthrobacter sp. NPDC090010 TaxID=3363942 RepID=UPI0038179E25
MGILLNLGRELVTTGPDGNHGVAAWRVALSVGLPVISLLLLGRAEWVIFVVFGSFASMYGRDEPRTQRILHQAEGAGLLIAGVALGSVLASLQVPIMTLILVEAVFAGLASVLADAARLNPVGPFWAIFALGACSSVPPALPFWVPPLLAAASAAMSVLLSFLIQGGRIRVCERASKSPP